MKPLLLFTALALLSSCSIQFERPLPTMDYGPAPTNYQSQIPAYFRTILKDPDSAKYEFDTPRRAYTNAGLAYGGRITWAGYAVRFQINAKNSYGGYTGFKPYTAFFSTTQVIEHREGWNPVLVTFID